MSLSAYTVVSSRLKDSELIKEFASLPKNLRVRIIYENTPIDFFPSPGFPVCYIAESDLHNASSAQLENIIQNISLKLKNHSSSLLILHRSPPTFSFSSGHYNYASLQLTLLEHSINILPVNSPAEAVRYLARLTHQHHKPPKIHTATLRTGNKTKDQTYATQLLQTVRCCPGVGKVKANLIIKEFKTIERLVNATEYELVSRVPNLGKIGARKIVEFFGRKMWDNGALARSARK